MTMKKVFWATAVFFAMAAHAADYPSRPIRMIVPQAPGSATDNVARVFNTCIVWIFDAIKT